MSMWNPITGDNSFFQGMPTMSEELDENGFKTHSYSFSSSSVFTPETGVVSQATKHYKDNIGREKKEEERVVGDSKVATTWIKNPDGQEETVRRLKSLKEEEVEKFNNEWDSKFQTLLPQQQTQQLQLPSVETFPTLESFPSISQMRSEFDSMLPNVFPRFGRLGQRPWQSQGQIQGQGQGQGQGQIQGQGQGRPMPSNIGSMSNLRTPSEINAEMTSIQDEIKQGCFTRAPQLPRLQKELECASAGSGSSSQ